MNLHFILPKYQEAPAFTIAVSIQNALCAEIIVVNHCIYQYFHCEFQGVCLLEDLLKPSGGVRRCPLVQIPTGEANSKPGLVYIIG